MKNQNKNQLEELKEKIKQSFIANSTPNKTILLEKAFLILNQFLKEGK